MLTQEQIARYHAEGFLCGIDILAQEEAETCRQKFDALEATEGREKTRIGLVNRHFDQRFIWELATHPDILDSVEALIGPNILLLATHFFCKYGQEEKFVAWHQDVTYWGLEPPLALTAWYAVDDSDTENGCMRAIPGTHIAGIRQHGKSGSEGNLLSVNQEVPVSAEEEAHSVDMPLRAGQISLHDGRLIHGSLPNRSTRRRCGLTLRYIPTNVRQINDNSHGQRWKTILVRGTDTNGNFNNAEAPF